MCSTTEESVAVGYEFGQLLMKVLKLPKRTRRFVLTCAVDSAVTVECEYFPEFTADSQEEFAAIVSRYELVEKEPEDDVADSV